MPPSRRLAWILAAAAGARSQPALAPEVRPSLVLWLSPASVEAARASRAVCTPAEDGLIAASAFSGAAAASTKS